MTKLYGRISDGMGGYRDVEVDAPDGWIPPDPVDASVGFTPFDGPLPTNPNPYSTPMDATPEEKLEAVLGLLRELRQTLGCKEAEDILDRARQVMRERS